MTSNVVGEKRKGDSSERERETYSKKMINLTEERERNVIRGKRETVL